MNDNAGRAYIIMCIVFRTDCCSSSYNIEIWLAHGVISVFFFF